MSYRYRSHHPHQASGHARHEHRAARALGPGASAFTFGHAGRQIRLGPIAFWSIVGSLVIMAAWSLATATYFAFQDDLLTRLIARQAEVQYAYEDRIADLRAQVDRLASRQLLDQEQYERKLEQLVRRQTALESRAAALGSLPDPVPTGSVRAPARNGASERPATPNAKSSALGDTIILVPPPEREAQLESRYAAASTRLETKTAAGGIEGALARLQASLDRVEASQYASVAAAEDAYETKARRMQSILADLGLNVSKVDAIKTGRATSGTGGPFIPAVRADASAFDRQIHRLHVARAQVERLTRTLVAVPIRKPITGEIELTSGFGMRLDPFLRAPAMHTGLDFRGETGDAVRATATGTVTQAGWNGGYGKMVEIDHGNGFSTRYAHLSATEVDVGQTVRIGQIVGKVGSTGRSTGPHLHYETRVDGDAVDPQKFLRAGIRLGSIR